MIRAAEISPCGRFRYWLSRVWDEQKPRMLFVMLNPSTADALSDDPTIRKCIGFARLGGFGSIEVVNLFAFRATDPRDLKAAGFPVGPENDAHILDACSTAAVVVCAWGRHAAKLARPKEVIRLLRSEGVELWALRLADDGTPWHPLMLPYSCSLMPLTRTKEPA